MNMWYMTIEPNINEIKTLAILRDQATLYALTGKDVFTIQDIGGALFTFSSCYLEDVFQGIIPDIGVVGVSIAGEPQYLALQKLDSRVQLNTYSVGLQTI